ncbi:peptidyl-tRNA hydrolase Pth2 [Methanopyrus sp.]
MSSHKYKQVIVVRDDLKLSRGKLAAQVAHASLGAFLRAKESGVPVEGWLEEGQKKVVLKCKDGEELLELYELAKKMGLPSFLVRDAGLTELEPGTMTCLGIGPEREEKIDRITGDLPLLR